MKKLAHKALSLPVLVLVLMSGTLLLNSCSRGRMCLHYTGKVNQFCGVVPDKDSISYIEKETIKFDTSYLIDSAYMKLYLSCDSNNNVLISKMISVKGKTFKTEVVYRDNIIEASIKLDSLAIVNTYKETHKEEFRKKTETKLEPIEIPVKHIPKYIWFLFGAACIICIIIGVKFGGLFKKIPFLR